jgi:hypothetical protein
MNHMRVRPNKTKLSHRGRERVWQTWTTLSAPRNTAGSGL